MVHTRRGIFWRDAEWACSQPSWTFTFYRAHCECNHFKGLENSLVTLKRALLAPYTLNFALKPPVKTRGFLELCHACVKSGSLLRSPVWKLPLLHVHVCNIGEMYLLLGQIFPVLIALNLKIELMWTFTWLLIERAAKQESFHLQVRLFRKRKQCHFGFFL